MHSAQFDPFYRPHLITILIFHNTNTVLYRPSDAPRDLYTTLVCSKSIFKIDYGLWHILRSYFSQFPHCNAQFRTPQLNAWSWPQLFFTIRELSYTAGFELTGGWGGRFTPPPQFPCSFHCDPQPLNPQTLSSCCVADPLVHFSQFEPWYTDHLMHHVNSTYDSSLSYFRLKIYCWLPYGTLRSFFYHTSPIKSCPWTLYKYCYKLVIIFTGYFLNWSHIWK